MFALLVVGSISKLKHFIQMCLSECNEMDSLQLEQQSEIFRFLLSIIISDFQTTTGVPRIFYTVVRTKFENFLGYPRKFYSTYKISIGSQPSKTFFKGTEENGNDG